MATPLIPYLVFAVSMIALWAIGDRGYFWPIWPLMGWGIPLLGQLSGHRASPELQLWGTCHPKSKFGHEERRGAVG